MDNYLPPRWRWFAAILVSGGLLGWVVWKVSPAEMARAAGELDWLGLGFLTLGMVLGLYLWDLVCLRWLFAPPEGRLSWRQVAGARAYSYLWSAFNYGAGQGVLGWKLALVQERALMTSLSRCALLAAHDLAILLGLGLFSSLAGSQPPEFATVFCGSGLGVLAILAIIWKLLPGRPREWLQQSRWGLWLKWWTWRHSLSLCLLRLVYYGIILVYAAAALHLCGIGLEAAQVGSVMPLVLLADSLPSVSGLGTRETALLTLLPLDRGQRGVVTNLSLFWSTGLMTGRAVMGLASWWLLPALGWLGGCPKRGRTPLGKSKDLFHEDAGDRCHRAGG